MKSFLILILLFLSIGLFAQQVSTAKIILKKGGTNYVTINGQDFRRGYLGTLFSIGSKGDTLTTINYQFSFPSPFLPPTNDTNYQNGDSGNGKFPTDDSLKAWLRRNFQ